MRGSCADADIVAFYVGSMGGALAGCGGSGLANGRPGIVLTDNASRNTFAHEIGHLLLGAQHANDASFGMENPGVDAITNVMYTPSGNITVDPPRVTDVQCNRLSISRVCLVPRIRVLGARTTATGTDVTAETVLPAAAPPTTPLESVRLLLQRDEDDGLELVVSMGQSVVPLMLMLINDPDLQVRARAGVVLARLTGPAAVQTLRPLAQTDPSPVVRLVTVNALARFAGAAAEPIVLGALQDPSSRVRIVALRSLVAVQTPAARMALEQAVIREPDLQIRELARRLAMGLGG